MNMKLKILALCGAAFFGSQLPGHIAYTETVSLKNRFFAITTMEAKKGNYVMFGAPPRALEMFTDIDKPLIKKVACIEGESISYLERSIYCDGKYIAYAPENKNSFQAHVSFTGTIPEGKAFVVGEHHNSGDSRYFGLIDLNGSKRVVSLW